MYYMYILILYHLYYQRYFNMKLEKSYHQNNRLIVNYTDSTNKIVYDLKSNTRIYSFDVKFENGLISELSDIQEFETEDITTAYISRYALKVYTINSKNKKGRPLTKNDPRLDRMYTDKQECNKEYIDYLRKIDNEYNLKLMTFKDELCSSLDIINNKINEL